MKKTKFSESDFLPFEDDKNIMMQIFGITCSVCGSSEIDYVAENAPTTIGKIAATAIKQNPNISDEQLDEILEKPIQAWQEVDDYNASIGMPTFACLICYQQLIDGEISISVENDKN